jgi:hypothetical protein
MTDPFDMLLTLIMIAVAAMAGILLVCTIYRTVFSSGCSNGLRDCTAVFLAATIVGFLAWTLGAYWFPDLANQRPPTALKLIATAAGLASALVESFRWDVSDPPTSVVPASVIEQGRGFVIIEPPSNTARPGTNLEPTLPSIAVRTAMDDAFDVRNPVSAWSNRIVTNAQIRALGDAARLAEAAGRTAETQTTSIDAMIRRDEKLTELRARQQFETTLFDEKTADQQENLTDAAHRRHLATERRKKEEHQAIRETLAAKHGVEAERKFKKIKFDLGEERARARMADVGVDRATADAAINELGGTSTRDRDQPLASLEEHIRSLRRRIEAAEAAGKDTVSLRDALRALEQANVST